MNPAQKNSAAKSTSSRESLATMPCSESLVVTLEVTCWSFSLGGEHYTGSVKGYQAKGKFHSMEITHKLTAKQALALNKKDGSKWGGRHKPGDDSGRFDTRAQIERKAIATFQKAFPHAIVLNTGSGCVADAQRVLVGPEWFKDAANELHAMREKVGGYEGDEATCTKLFHAYRKLLAELISQNATGMAAGADGPLPIAEEKP